MIVHTLNKTIQSLDFPIFIQYDDIPPFPPFLSNTKKPLLHEHIPIHPKLANALELPLLPAICVQFVVV